MSANAPELACQELVEIITDYLEGALPPSERERFDAHIQTCDGCRDYLEQMRITIRLVGMLSEDDMETAARDHLLQLFRDWHRG